LERYPDPSDSLPIPVAAWYFVHTESRQSGTLDDREAAIAGQMIKQKNRSGDRRSAVVEMRAALAGKIAAHVPAAGGQATAVPGLRLYRRTAPTACSPVTYEPSLTVFAQGRKRINLGETTYLCDESTFLLTSVDVPVVSQIVAASEEVPLLSMNLALDMAVVREILGQEELPEPEASSRTRGIAVGKTTPELLGACSRLLDLLDSPADIRFFSKMIQREIVYRLLRGPQGERLRAIATLGDQSHRTAKAIAWLKANYTKPLRVEELAEVARMGISTLHHHFRALTAMSPLQYQKQLRLVAARERMLIEGLDAASAAFEVGYESPSQFNREYKRFFGQPPMRDIRTRRPAEFTTIHD
jgi:AraC-like DNA-binding protein